MGRASGLLSAVVIVGLGAGLALRQPRVNAQEATRAAAATPCPATTAAENKVLATRYTEEHRSDPSVNATLLGDQVKRHRVLGDQVYTAAQAVAIDRAFAAAFPDLQVTIDAIVAEGDLVAVAWTAKGAQQGAFYGIPPTGRTAQWEGQDMLRFACGKIVEVWVSADALGLYMQLGAITEAERTSLASPTPIATLSP